VDVQPQAGLKRCTVSQNEIAFAMVVEATPAPAALLAGGRRGSRYSCAVSCAYLYHKESLYIRIMCRP
jgi:hypothetical protein